MIEMITSEGVLNTIPTGLTAQQKKDIANKLKRAGFFAKFGITNDEVKTNINPSLTDDQADRLIEIVNKKIVIVRPIRTDPTNPESIHDYENYLQSVYAPYGITLTTTSITDGTTTINLRERYPHEREPITGVDEVIYNPSDANTITAIKNHYLNYYESQMANLSLTPIAKNKADFMALLNAIRGNTVYNSKNLQNPSDLDDIINELTTDTTDQTNEIGNTKIEIPATYIMGHQAEKYTIILREETYQRIENKLKAVFGNSAGDNIAITRVPANTLTVARIKRRNQYIINKIKTILRTYDGRRPIEMNGTDRTTQRELQKMLNILDFNEATYTDPTNFTELIGGYVPTDKLDTFLASARSLAEVDFDFRGQFKNFVPVRIPTSGRPADSKNIGQIMEYEKALKAAYKNCLPELFHTDDYNFKRDRKKYPHEMFKWNGDDPSIEETNSNIYTQYYDSIYKDLVHYRRCDRITVRKVTKAPGALLKKIFNSNEITRTIRDIGKAIRENDRKVGPDGTTLSEGNARFYGFLEKLRLNSMIATGAIIVKSCVSGFTFSMLGPAALAVVGATGAMEVIAMCKRIYNMYREIMEQRVQISYSEKGLDEAIRYKTLLETAGPEVSDATKERYRTILKAYIAYYIANYNKYMRSYKRLKRDLKYTYGDDRDQLIAEEEEYRTTTFVDYWDDAIPLVSRYTDLNKEEFKEKIEAIEHGRSRY